MRIILSWSGGKDSSLALAKLKEQPGVEVTGLFTVYDESTGKVKLHGIPMALVRKQAESLGLPLYELPLPSQATNEAYEAAHIALFQRLIKEDGLNACAFGDLFLEEIKAYRDKLSAKAGLAFIYPLWDINPKALSEDVLQQGFWNLVVSVDAARMPASMLGQQYDKSFVNALPDGVDICGENGEFHSFAWDGPGFSFPISYRLGETYKEDYRPAINMCMLYQEIFPAE